MITINNAPETVYYTADEGEDYDEDDEDDEDDEE
jgi:hypothetical protein